MNWSTAEIKYEEFPLLLRRPDHSNIWEFHGRFTQLVGIQHLLEKVTSNGLAETDYNDTLAEFDNHMSTLFNNSDDGIIFLVETYAGKRNYYFYTLPEFDISPFIDRAKSTYNVKLDSTVRDDTSWRFLKEYPVQLFAV